MKKVMIGLVIAFAPVAIPVAHADPGGPPCDERLTKVIKVDPQTGNAIQQYNPPGCDLGLPMIGGT